MAIAMAIPRISCLSLLKSSFVTFALLLVVHQSLQLRASKTPDAVVTRSENAGNATLGFGALLAVTPNNPPTRMFWRKSGMQHAAEYTSLDIQYPIQPKWNESDIKHLLSNSNGQLKSNAALAWLGHLYTLQQASRYKTALIFEDDIDWDITIRKQMVKTAEALWRLTQPPHSGGTQPSYSDDTQPSHSDHTQPSHSDDTQRSHSGDTDITSHDEPYGMAWDILWLGHCGSSLPDDKNVITSFLDPTIPPDTKTSIPRLRYIYQTGSPICTFAYAVRQEVALDIIKRATGQDIAFDVWLHFQCEHGHLRCFAANPTLFHQHEMPGAHDSLINGKDSGTIVKLRTTEHIWHSARCNADLGGTVDNPVVCGF